MSNQSPRTDITIYGLWTKDGLVKAFKTKKAGLRYIGKHHISGYLGPILEQDLRLLEIKHGYTRGSISGDAASSLLDEDGAREPRQEA